MNVALDKVNKRFGAQRVLKEVSLELRSGSITGLTGPNGSGKSTLLQIIAGALKPDAGTVAYTHANKDIEPDLIFRQISIAAPYLNLYEDFELDTAITVHRDFKPLVQGLSNEDLLNAILLSKASQKKIRDLSSGMLQRLKLGLALFSDTPLLLLDEPGSNLDSAGMEWYRELLAQQTQNRTVLICSNREEEELRLCERVLSIREL